MQKVRRTRSDTSLSNPTTTPKAVRNTSIPNHDDTPRGLSCFDPRYKYRSRKPPRLVIGDARGPLGLLLLHSSDEPLVDLIFVHGLGGDSIKTWCKHNDLGLFWPKYWLPGMGHANIHSFGYEWEASRKPGNVFDVDEFGQGLLEEMKNSPHMCADSKVSLLR